MTGSESHTAANNSQNIRKLGGIGLVLAGIFLITIIAILWFSIRTPQSELESLNVEYKNPTINVPVNPYPTPIDIVIRQSIEKESISNTVAVNIPEQLVDSINSEVILERRDSTVEDFSKLLEGYGDDTLLEDISPKSWSDHDWLLPDLLDEQVNSFDDLNIDLIGKSEVTVDLISGLPEKLSIPILGLTAPIKNLEIIEENGQQVYETPKHLVGRIPSSPEESDSFKGWYFGHLESPIKGEGNVFHDLPEIAEHLLNGNKVLISLEKSGKHLIYQATRSEIVHESELKLYDPGNETIVLVTCSNRPLYDHRQLVTATLVGLVK